MYACVRACARASGEGKGRVGKSRIGGRGGRGEGRGGERGRGGGDGSAVEEQPT